MKKTREDKENDLIASLKKQLDLSDHRVRKRLMIESMKQGIFHTTIGEKFLLELRTDQGEKPQEITETKRKYQVVLPAFVVLSVVVIGSGIVRLHEANKKEEYVIANSIGKNQEELQSNDSKLLMEEVFEQAEFIDISNSYVIADSNRYYLNESQIKGMTYEQMKLSMYEISARYGRKFYDTGIQGYFESKNWYQPLSEEETYSDALLNDVERSNIILIKECMDWYEEEYSEAVYDYSLVTIDEMKNMLLKAEFTQEEIEERNDTEIKLMYYGLMEIGKLQNGKISYEQIGAMNGRRIQNREASISDKRRI